MNNITVWVVSAEEISREEFEEMTIVEASRLKTLVNYTLEEYMDMLNDEIYPENEWVRIN